MLASDCFVPLAYHLVRTPCETPSLKCSETWICALVYHPSDRPWSSPLETAERDRSVPWAECSSMKPVNGVLVPGNRSRPSSSTRLVRAISGSAAGTLALEFSSGRRSRQTTKPMMTAAMTITASIRIGAAPDLQEDRLCIGRVFPIRTRDQLKKSSNASPEQNRFFVTRAHRRLFPIWNGSLQEPFTAGRPQAL